MTARIEQAAFLQGNPRLKLRDEFATIQGGEDFVDLGSPGSHVVDQFVSGAQESCPVGPMTDFLEGGGPQPLRLSERAVAYLKQKQQ